MDFRQDIVHYLEKEIQFWAIVCPFEVPPFDPPVDISKLNLVPKKDRIERCVILDLSFPKGALVNDGIDSDTYLLCRNKLTFPSVDDLVCIIHYKGLGCLLFKQDLLRAYRQLKVDPGDVHRLGYCFEGKYYFDLSLPMDLYLAARCYQMVTEVFFFSEEGYSAVP